MILFVDNHRESHISLNTTLMILEHSKNSADFIEKVAT